MPLGSLKSHWFSAIPMKSRMAGSLAQALRKAARVNSDGTPLRKNAMMSVSPTIDSMEGRLAGSKGASGMAIASEPAEAASISSCAFAACFNRAQRDNGFSCSLIAYNPCRILKRWCLSIALPFDEGPLHMMGSNEPVDNVSDFRGHRHRFNQIAPGIRKRFPLCRICRDGQQLVRRFRGGRTHVDPQTRHTRCEVVAVIRRLSAMQFDHRFARIEQSYFVIGT